MVRRGFKGEKPLSIFLILQYIYIRGQRMTELLNELEQKKEILQKEAELYKQRRDALNNETTKWAEKRNEFNDRAKEFLEKAEQHKEKRDEYKKELKNLKNLRDELDRKAERKYEEIKKLKKKNIPKLGENLNKLKRELRELEFKQMTTVLKVEEEKKIVKILKELRTKVQQKEKELEEIVEIKVALSQLKEIESQLDEYIKKIEEFADLADKERVEMIKAYEMVDSLRRDADKCQEELVKSKMVADEEHKKFIETVNLIQDYEKIIFGLRKKMKVDRKSKEVSETKKHAEELYNRLLKGEKLTTEEFMLIQKAGLL